MKDTFSPDMIYDIFGRVGFPVLRIDHFDRGNYAEIRAQLDYPEYLSVLQLQEVTGKLSILEKSENIRIEIVNIDMIHHTIRVNVIIDGQ